jgi:DNA-3-methyladenine glycosylase
LGAVRKGPSSSHSAKPAAPPRALPTDFFARPALVVARELIGKYLVRRDRRQETSALIVETEAYIGPHDLACHGSKGLTPRTQVLFGPPAHWYVYLIYGLHWMVNAVTDDEGHPAAVLLRAAGPWNGPGKLTKALAIDKTLNGRPIAPSSGLWIEDRGVRVPARRINRTPRIGVDYAGLWAHKPYRFLLRDPSTTPLPATPVIAPANGKHRAILRP